MKQFIALIFFVFGLQIANANAQKIEINTNEELLSEILIKLRDSYDFQFSYNNDLLSSYSLSVNKSFSSKEKAIAYLLKQFPLNYELSGDVFLIYPNKKIKQYRIFGQFLDKESLEPLPFSHLSVNGQQMATDEMGNFSYTSQTDSIYRVLASHLGYFIHDTIVKYGENRKFYLTAAITDLDEVIVSDKIVQTFIKESNQAGNLKLNHKIAGFLPTNNDNSVFELLRLQPGILAAGEQKNDISIWGSYEGESQVLFDDITLWGLKNFYEDIGPVNPLVVKNIEVLKGGYDSRYGDRVGGIVHITGKNGSKIKPTLNLALNNITASGSYEQPISKQSSLLLAFRHTYYNLFKNEQIKFTSSNANSDQLNEQFPSAFNLDVAPNYKFRDANIKFSTNWNNGDQLIISLLGGEDRYSYDITNKNLTNSKKHRFEGNYQYGGSVKYNKVWSNGNTTAISVSRSELDKNTTDQTIIENDLFNYLRIRKDDRSYNNITEYRIKLMNRFVLSKNLAIETGINYTQNKVDLKEDSLGINILHINSKIDKIGAYFQNIFNLNKNITLKTGFQANYPVSLKKLYWEPRASLSIKANDELSFNGAFGLYKQFISKSSVLSNNGSYRFIWIGSNKNIPVVKAEHYVLGGSYHRNNFTFSLEGYYKKTDGHTRYYRYRTEENISLGKSKSYGIDFFAKKDFGEHTFWVSYSLSKTEENFDYFNKTNEYIRALHDQTHEIKTAGLLSLKPFYLSANYIYGSGFPIFSGYNTIISEPDYQRLDAAIIYKFKVKKVKSEVGILFQNILDNKNITTESFEKVPLNQMNNISVYTEAVSSSIRLYFKLSI